MSIDSKAEKIAAAQTLGDKCGYHGFSSAQYDAQISKMSKLERAAFARGMYEGCMRKKQELQDAKR